MFDKGVSLLKKGDIESAKRYYLQKISKRKDKTALLELGRIYFKEGNYQEAKKYLKEFVSMKPQKEEIKMLLEITNAIKITSFEVFSGPAEFSPNGNMLAYTKAIDTNLDGKLDFNDRPGIYIYDISKNQEWNIVEDMYYNSSVCFSPDGRKICYLSARKEDPHYKSSVAIYLYDLEKNHEIKLVDESYNPKQPIFSSNGIYIYFLAQPLLTNPNRGVYRINTENMKIDTIIRESFDTISFDISKKGDIVYLQKRDERYNNYSIFFIDAARNIETQIVKPYFINEAPKFSSDGEKIIYLSTRRDTNGDGSLSTLDNPGIYVYDLKNKKEICVVNDERFNSQAEFIPEKDEILFISTWEKFLDKEKIFGYKGIYMLKKRLFGHKITQVMSEKYYGYANLRVAKNGLISYSAFAKNKPGRAIFIHKLNLNYTLEELYRIVENL
ncbi:MAG: tetratricopeptide repeat protein [bacterium]|nr:tetratricopeptide repeat protein [bacterium]